jgi:S-methylmethionine-dependent homocysteine/selenocysteine methylase
MPASLPQSSGDRLFLTDGGLETTLIFHDGIDLPLFAAFPLLDSDEGRAALRGYFAPYLELAAERGTGFVLDTPTWRANADWGLQLGYDRDALARVNRDAVAFAREQRAAAGGAPDPIVVNGVIGPRGDGYVAGEMMTAEAAAAYHALQADAFAAAGADMLTAVTMTHVGEATGVARAAASAGLPCAIAFTVETDGRLPSGQPLGEAIAAVEAATGSGPAYYMVNCAHPSHFAHVLAGLGDVAARIGGLRVNASSKSHAELDEATELDEGDPAALHGEHAELLAHLPRVTVIGGCCGTDARHVASAAGAYAG